MGKVSDRESRVILGKLCKVVPAFYLLLYICSGIFIMGYDLPYDGTLPFEHKTFGKACDLGRAALATQVLGLLLLPVVLALLVRSASLAWDYVLTLLLLHLALTCLVTLSWPSNWRWWVSVCCLGLYAVFASEAMSYVVEARRSAKVADAVNGPA